jgi:hypothetical protein
VIVQAATEFCGFATGEYGVKVIEPALERLMVAVQVI